MDIRKNSISIISFLDPVIGVFLERILKVLINRPGNSSSGYLKDSSGHNAFNKAFRALSSIDDPNSVSKTTSSHKTH